MHTINSLSYAIAYYKRLNNCAAPAPDSDDVLVVEEEVFICAGHGRMGETRNCQSRDGGR